MNLIKRIFGGAIILFILLAVTFMGHMYLSIAIGIFSLIAVKEMANGFENIGYHTPILLTCILNILIMIEAYINDTKYSIIGLVMTLMFAFMYMIFSKKFVMKDFFPMFFILAYMSILMSHIIKIRDLKFVYMLYIISWGSDTFAYLFGSKFGKRKIKSIAHISPNKTVAGFIGGIFGAVLLNVIYVKFVNVGLDLSIIIIFTIISAIVSQIGDLIASFIKRNCGIKDFGHLIPGHGGILDRFDSMLFVSPILYLLSIL